MRMESLPLETLQHIFSFACLDDGFTGRSLSRVSTTIRSAARTTRFQSISLYADYERVVAFVALYKAQRAASPEHHPHVWHLSINFHARLADELCEIPQWREDLRYLFRNVAKDLRSILILVDTERDRALQHSWPIFDCPFPVLQDVTAVALSDIGILVNKSSAVPVFPVATHIHLVAAAQMTSFNLPSWLSHVPRSTHLRVSHINYWNRGFPKNFEHALDFSLPRRPDPGMQPVRRTHTRPSKPPRPITHPHLRYIMLQPAAAPAPGGWCGTGPAAYEAFTTWLDRLATYKGLVNLEVVPVTPFAHRVSYGQWCKLAKEKWLGRMNGGLGCWDLHAVDDIQPEPWRRPAGANR
ncbi:hypothetical protein C8Q70DRAFT_609036 [Cubamyces menziesii]|uniref:F-box domain-containing protein n=1 Tax=Trametes cubensis TaxID=1111947 RepID=A0AAD7TZQ5_9APHY|nr:hypothetical protein C8Q70DRAFT_609036 [Cubamyces menziesii]KAJ8494350.1 hypothetical protein ONZ51_g2374 [Trametes cubensis]